MAELSESSQPNVIYPPKTRQTRDLKMKGIAQTGVLNENDVVKKIARKRNIHESPIEPVKEDHFPIKSKPNDVSERYYPAMF